MMAEMKNPIKALIGQEEKTFLKLAQKTKNWKIAMKR